MQTACYASVSAGTVNQLETASFETGNMRGRPASDARHCPLPDTGEREQAVEGTAAFAPSRHRRPCSRLVRAAARRRKRRAPLFRKRAHVSYHVRNVFTFGEEPL